MLERLSVFFNVHDTVQEYAVLSSIKIFNTTGENFTERRGGVAEVLKEAMT